MNEAQIPELYAPPQNHYGKCSFQFKVLLNKSVHIVATCISNLFHNSITLIVDLFQNQVNLLSVLYKNIHFYKKKIHCIINTFVMLLLTQREVGKTDTCKESNRKKNVLKVLKKLNSGCRLALRGIYLTF